jgi:ribonuclease HI
MMGLEPTTLGTTNRCSNQLSYIYRACGYKNRNLNLYCKLFLKNLSVGQKRAFYYHCRHFMIEIFTDGASSGNPGPGGYGTILRSGKHYKELAEGFRKTTNNRMELLAVIKGLEALKTPNQQVTIYSDSKYVVDAIEKRWVNGWVAKGFAGKKNKDLWLRYLDVSKLHNIRFVWIKGHAGHPENERCDRLAVAAAQQKTLLIDSVFEMESSK